MKKEIYVLQKKKVSGYSVFLAGPSPRTNLLPSWRPHMINIIRQEGYQGDIISPEKKKHDFEEYDCEINTAWEYQHMKIADKIIFWIPREMIAMPALTSNVEFGEFLHSGKILLAYPPNAQNMIYLQVKAKMNNVPVVNSMEDAAKWLVSHY